MSKLLKMTAFIGMIQFLCIPYASGVTKLSTTMETVESYVTTGTDYLAAAQDAVNEVQTEYNKYKMLAEQGELDEYLKKEAIAYGKEKGKPIADKEIAKYKAKQERKKLEKKTKELAAKQAEIADYEKSMDEEQKTKLTEITKRLTELNVQLQRKDLKKEEFEKIRDEVASLEAQQQAILDKPKEHDATLQGKKAEEKKIAEEIEKSKPEAEKAEKEENLQAKSADLFGEEDASADNKSIYQTEIEALFLKENEESTSENLARIKKNRNMEYYLALQNAMNVSLLNAERAAATEEGSEQNKKAGADVEGNLTVKNVNISEVIEKAKAASHLTEALLAEMRFKTIKDMVSWNNKNRLYDYKKPVTEFDLDYYELKKTDLKDKLKGLYDKNKDKIKGLYDNNKDNVKNLWHKL
jgi:chromosome segregation ATPase